MSNLRGRIQKMLRPTFDEQSREMHHLICWRRRRGRRWFRYILDPNRCSHRELQEWQRHRRQLEYTARTCPHRFQNIELYCDCCGLDYNDIAFYSPPKESWIR